ncbi:Crp/Fnr family transcriptional regulator [Thiorhodococcus minor]|uniref:Crp/Fnr family transcriptional regulator n=1 Tax=Thiorhodococcus minor TaxID=57489 RepID=A0A6M0K5M5_9GAMM|nr:Crp/Fnr family transcriptional regulator [Thiorhodococcus minor]NEV65078.1 Crp/Fnr family transcriptional regulator [Thiorhodococcus minor]
MLASSIDLENEENEVPCAKSPDCHVNRILAALPETDRWEILTWCEPVELQVGEVISEPGERIRDVYFPTDSFVSLVTPPADHAGLEVWLVGNEGMVGTPLVLGVEVTVLRTLVQGAGSAWRMSAERLGDALRRSDALHRTLDRYLSVLMSQGAQMVACTRFHVVEARLARWLLMSQDRAHSDHFHVTHEVLAAMLGVRRVGVTKAATALQQRDLIRYRRGEVAILDRAGLGAAACGCYGAMESLYAQVLC